RSSVPGILHRVGGRTLLETTLALVEKLSPAKTVVVPGGGRRLTEDALAGHPVTILEQDPSAAAGGALRRALGAIAGEKGPVLVLSGGLPLLRIETLASVIERQRRGGPDPAVLSFRPPA